ncbi:hypothetical protein QCA50_007167 [Cerrena zonata]|uniref:Phytase-like domain-containing protein n=1 Tax=Cerrena zonata TaxID=2478898 RepID=A0AAW0GE07_9APHY
MVYVAVAGIAITLAGFALASPVVTTRASEPTEADPDFFTSVNLNGVTFVNKGLVAFGLIPSDFKESTGDTLGGIGSAIALKKGSFKKNTNGTFGGTLVTQPDRGFNIDGTVNYQARQHAIDFVLSPYYGDGDLSFTAAQNTLQLTYKSTLLYTERNDVQTSGLDPIAIRAAQPGFPNAATADPQMPIASTSLPHLSVDAEGLALNDDGTFWVSDEYGPYIYRLDSQGHLIQTIQPPEAILPMFDGKVNFTAEENPDTGRTSNQGFEGLTTDDTGNTLYALLQSATIQDGGGDKTTSRFTRLFAFNISDPSAVRPPLIGEWVVPLPQSKKDKTRASSEVHFVHQNVFLVLARDGNGHGDDDTESSYKQADLIDISSATNIAGTKFDSPKNPIAKKGKLDKSITAATYVGFVDFIDDTQLARFGLHNGDPADQTLIDAKWESLALAPVDDPLFPDDFFLFTAADNDFISTHGVSLGQPFDAGMDVDNQFMVFRVTLPKST